MASAGISGTAVFVTLVGGVLVVAGFKNRTVSDSLKSFLRGEIPTGLSSSPAGQTSGAGAPPPSTPSGGGGSNFWTIADSLYKGGFTSAGVAGALGNMRVESGGDNFPPTAYNSSEGAIGICQWEKGRRVALQGYAAARGLSESDLTAQLGYMWVELTSAFAHVRIQGMAARDPRAFAAVWDAEYEISSGSTRSERENYAAQYYQTLAAQHSHGA